MRFSGTQTTLSNETLTGGKSPRRFRSFKTKLMSLVALAVAVPALLTCLILGMQLDRQARAQFANGLSANLETFALILQDAAKNLFEGVTRMAADNTLQITLDLEMKSQLTRYLEAQREVLAIALLAVYDKDSHTIAFSGNEKDHPGLREWRFAATGETPGADCVVARDADRQVIACHGVFYLVSALPVFRARDSSLGDATTSRAAQLLGYLLGATPLGEPALIASLSERRIAHPIIGTADHLIYSGISTKGLRWPISTDGTVREYLLDGTAYLGVGKTLSIGTGKVVYGVMTPLAPLQSALWGSVMTVAGVGLLLVIGALIALSFIANRLLRPIQQLREGAARIGSGDLGQRIAITTGDELEALADQFNDMAARLEESYADLERKVEVRTGELAQSVKELRALGDVIQAVNLTLDVDTVLSTIVTKAVELSGTDAGAIYVTEKSHEEFALRATCGMSEAMISALKDQHVGFGESTVAQATARRAPVQVPDLREGSPSAIQEIILRSGYLALLVVPLLDADDVVGALVVRRKQPGRFPEHTVDLLQTFAAQSVVAIQNANLFGEIEEKSRQLAAASQHKSQFLANMSHELRTPLNAILGYTELILDDIYGETPDKMRVALDRVQSNGKHLLGLINDVLDLSKIEAGQLNLSLGDYSIKNVVDGVFAAIESLATAKKLALKVEVPSDLPTGRGDEHRLTQVLLNMVGNAIKFTDAGEVVIKASAENGSYTVAVRDTGPGIAEADQIKIFDEFQQVDSSVTKQKGGTGLGLSIARRIVEMHGGRLSVESKLGEGSTFFITLPVNVERQARRP